jgi:hypothetical protein
MTLWPADVNQAIEPLSPVSRDCEKNMHLSLDIRFDCLYLRRNTVPSEVRGGSDMK